ncbi:L-lactate dehydrogenase complex protein LldG [Filimonas lacunae]|uniref:L-lactate dehydrogenase complex protein LldG n=1 Tax=Filimonas lacunae TaxID=477680 RepID=A0A173MNB0_9BACT|nr:LUD domain-containing protein [Filimonas lacunae]BAV08868.1 L-lactate dehydrogenase, hypothetical protein subunit [Filimonas lacunae]SIS63074.1 L-lactate dehydrogenase complex protein LldG [Filimonas lacunae]
MSSREDIIKRVQQNQPPAVALPNTDVFINMRDADVEQFKQTFRNIGGALYEVNNYEQVIEILRTDFAAFKKKITTLKQLEAIADTSWFKDDPHSLHDAEVMIAEAHFGVCENGAVWITEPNMVQRASVFIGEHLVMLVRKSSLVATMHDAYVRIASLHDSQYGFGAFIAGPSKTADIEQSLVLGAHGPRTMTMMLMD